MRLTISALGFTVFEVELVQDDEPDAEAATVDRKGAGFASVDIDPER